MQNEVLAVFDLDGTLTSGVSLDRDFVKFLIKERKLGFTPLLIHAAYFLAMIPFDRVAAVKRNKYYLRGMTGANLSESAKTFVARYNSSLLINNAFSMLYSHRNAGHMNILLTGALHPLVKELIFQLDLSVDRFFATELCEDNGMLTGRIHGTHFYGENKANLVKELTLQTGADLSQSFCYADSITDLPMMELFGNPVAVNPDKKLAAVAKERSWHIVNHEITGVKTELS
jgi:HAD superfamily hydrolase (TIGR01490 family)